MDIFYKMFTMTLCYMILKRWTNMSKHFNRISWRSCQSLGYRLILTLTSCILFFYNFSYVPKQESFYETVPKNRFTHWNMNIIRKSLAKIEFSFHNVNVRHNVRACNRLKTWSSTSHWCCERVNLFLDCTIRGK